MISKQVALFQQNYLQGQVGSQSEFEGHRASPILGAQSPLEPYIVSLLIQDTAEINQPGGHQSQSSKWDWEHSEVQSDLAILAKQLRALGDQTPLSHAEWITTPQRKAVLQDQWLFKELSICGNNSS